MNNMEDTTYFMHKFSENNQRIFEQEEKLQILREERQALLSRIEKYDNDISRKERWIQRCYIENKFMADNDLL